MPSTEAIAGLVSRPILFSAPMVRALLAGTKTQTRRVVKPQPPEECTHLGPVIGSYSGAPVPRFYWQTAKDYDRAEAQGKEFVYWPAADDEESDGFTGDVFGPGGLACPYGQPGDRLWVRETFAKIDGQTQPWIETDYRATYTHGARLGDTLGIKKRWTPAIHMPRAASRITLEVTSVRVERLQDISEADAQAEGACAVDAVSGREVLFPEASGVGSYRLGYRALWEQINGPGNWAANPWVWAVSFRVVKP